MQLRVQPCCNCNISEGISAFARYSCRYHATDCNFAIRITRWQEHKILLVAYTAEYHIAALTTRWLISVTQVIFEKANVLKLSYVNSNHIETNPVTNHKFLRNENVCEFFRMTWRKGLKYHCKYRCDASSILIPTNCAIVYAVIGQFYY
jgi:hypothetical protein